MTSNRRPGPSVLQSLLEATNQDRIQTARKAVDELAHQTGWSPSDRAALEQGHLFYYLAFVSPFKDLIEENTDRAEAFQLTAVLVWRVLDTLLDGDPLLRAVHRHRDLAHAGLARLRSVAADLGLDWRGVLRRDFHTFSLPPPLDAPPEDETPDALLNRFLEEHFSIDVHHRASFLLALPKALGLPRNQQLFYEYYIALVTLDDDLDDLVADRVAGRQTALVRYFDRLGLFGPGQMQRLMRVEATLRRYLEDQLRATRPLAASYSPAAATVLSVLANAAGTK